MRTHSQKTSDTVVASILFSKILSDGGIHFSLRRHLVWCEHSLALVLCVERNWQGVYKTF